MFQGMRRDNHQIKQDGQFLWDAHNIRLTNREDSTLFSITNEKGTSDALLTLNDKYVGHCVLGKYLIVFTSVIIEKQVCDPDYVEPIPGMKAAPPVCVMKDFNHTKIYRIRKTDDGFEKIVLFSDSTYDMWSPENPIEALGVYETELIQKVYWVDGVHQPRVINIKEPELKEISFEDNDDLTEALEYDRHSFDFVQAL